MSSSACVASLGLRQFFCRQTSEDLLNLTHVNRKPWPLAKKGSVYHLFMRIDLVQVGLRRYGQVTISADLKRKSQYSPLVLNYTSFFFPFFSIWLCKASNEYLYSVATLCFTTLILNETRYNLADFEMTWTDISSDWCLVLCNSCQLRLWFDVFIWVCFTYPLIPEQMCATAP